MAHKDSRDHLDSLVVQVSGDQEALMARQAVQVVLDSLAYKETRVLVDLRVHKALPVHPAHLVQEEHQEDQDSREVEVQLEQQALQDSREVKVSLEDLGSRDGQDHQVLVDKEDLPASQVSVGFRNPINLDTIMIECD